MTERKVNRRFLIAVGASTYRDGAIRDLPGVPHDVRRVHDLLEPMGYTRALPELSADPGADALRRGIDRWVAEADLGADDVVVVYFAGHGVKAADRHYLLCSDTEHGLWSSTALASEDLCRPLLTSPVGHVLAVLDTCYAGAGSDDISVLAADLAATQKAAAGRWLLAAARAKEKARENAFVDALAEVLDQPRAGAHPEFLGVREVTERINAHFRARHATTQHASHSTVDSDGYAPFFRNPAHIPDLPADDLDIATLTRLRRRTRGHFDPRGRGLEHAGERGDHFTGRTAALTELASWLRAERHDRKARVVTGDPGSGKSALLGRLLMLTDPDSPARARTPRDALPPPGLTVVPLHARRATAEELTADLAAALGIPALGIPSSDRDDLLHALGERTEPVTVLVDALDEAGTAGDSREGARIARELLQPMTTLPALRLIIGTRRPLVAALGRATVTVDLDDTAYVTGNDITDYVRALLLDGQDPDSRSPYRDRPRQADTVAHGIAARSGRSFLVARMTARALVQGQITVDTARPGWQDALPSDAGQAFAAYLARFGLDQDKAERLLRPLAYAQGSGLPWSTLWAPLAAALSGVPCPDQDLRWLHEHAGAYIVEAATPAGTAYRLFHETMAEHLRSPGRDTDAHRTVTTALLAQVPADPRTGRRDWPAAHPYVRDHLATHAAASGGLDRLLHDTDYLVHATPGPLSHALHGSKTPECRLRCAVYRASADTHALLGPEARRDILAIDAARYNEPDLARELARGRPWQPRWATGTLVHPALHRTLAGHTSAVAEVACTTIDGRPHAVATDGGYDHTLRVWDLTDGTQRATLTGHTESVEVVDCATIHGRPHAVTGSADGTVRVWDLTTGTERATLTGHTGEVLAVACTTIHGRPHAVTGGYDKKLYVWDLTDFTRRAAIPHPGRMVAAVCTTLHNRPHAVTTSNRDGTVRVWDLTTGTLHATSPSTGVLGVASTTIDGRSHIVTGSYDKAVRVWDLTDGTLRATLTGHSSWVSTVACTTIDGRPHAVTGSADGTVRIWDLTDGTERATLTGHTRGVLAVACTEIDGGPHAVTGSYDKTVRVWDLANGTQRSPLTGHVGRVAAVTGSTIDGRPHAITGGGAKDHSVRVWNLTTGTQRVTFTGHRSRVSAVAACVTADDRPLAISTDGGFKQTMFVWDLTDGTEHVTLKGHTRGVLAVACATIDGRPHAVTGSHDKTVRIWDLTDGTERATLTGHTSWIAALACTTIDGRPHAVTGGYDKTLRIWDLTDGTQRASLAHTECVSAVACTSIDGRPHALASDRQTLRVWDLTDGTQRAALTGHTHSVSAVACTTIDDRPHALSGSGYEKRLRIWDLTVNRFVESISLPLPVDTLAAIGSDLVIGMNSEVAVLTRVADLR